MAMIHNSGRLILAIFFKQRTKICVEQRVLLECEITFACTKSLAICAEHCSFGRCIHLCFRMMFNVYWSNHLLNR